jgi:hypothetical protein
MAAARFFEKSIKIQDFEFENFTYHASLTSNSEMQINDSLYFMVIKFMLVVFGIPGVHVEILQIVDLQYLVT